MDHDVLVKEWNRLTKLLAELTPGTEEYKNVKACLIDVSHLIMDHDRMCEELNEHDRKFAIDQQKVDQSHEDAIREAEAKERAAKRQIVMDYGKEVVKGVFMLTGVVLTIIGADGRILDKNALNMIWKPKA